MRRIGEEERRGPRDELALITSAAWTPWAGPFSVPFTGGAWPVIASRVAWLTNTEGMVITGAQPPTVVQPIRVSVGSLGTLLAMITAIAPFNCALRALISKPQRPAIDERDVAGHGGGVDERRFTAVVDRAAAGAAPSSTSTMSAVWPLGAGGGGGGLFTKLAGKAG